MVKKSICSFCRNEIDFGRGMMKIMNDGSIYHFCSTKCKKSQLIQKKNPRKTKWTRVYGQQ